jgi:ABC-type molybdenum transport system ATPase subunit/photorepair protein PhrA
VPALAGNFLAGLHWKRHGAASCSFKMISFSNINKQYGKQLLFVDASFQLNPGEKFELVGPNGAGKTTLFRMVVGEETPDEGAVDKTHRRLSQDRLLPGRLDPLIMSLVTPERLPNSRGTSCSLST